MPLLNTRQDLPKAPRLKAKILVQVCLQPHFVSLFPSFFPAAALNSFLPKLCSLSHLRAFAHVRTLPLPCACFSSAQKSTPQGSLAALHILLDFYLCCLIHVCLFTNLQATVGEVLPLLFSLVPPACRTVLACSRYLVTIYMGGKLHKWLCVSFSLLG